ncbi:hypothetical protein BVC80_9073g110 [Macleaya cordata]|uniref:DUF7866 domain-containing protein n=1 Tax=Macleaya cordata TaxID=56857 RepID=A0A200PTX2_MACCD|nr:hypothetical protein BVC80_9073g110 [Macleaya cordata]
MSGFGSLFSRFLLFFFVTIFTISQARFSHGLEENSSMVPLIDDHSRMVGSLVLNETRRRLGRFRICALCTCCGGPKGLCLPSPCCYSINCNIPHRPFGFCSFTPKSWSVN